MVPAEFSSANKYFGGSIPSRRTAFSSLLQNYKKCLTCGSINRTTPESRHNKHPRYKRYDRYNRCPGYKCYAAYNECPGYNCYDVYNSCTRDKWYDVHNSCTRDK